LSGRKSCGDPGKPGRHRVYPVVDEGGRPAGLVSRADALRWIVEAIHDSTDSAREIVGERVSDPSLPQVHPGDAVSHVIDLMLATDQGRLPVTDLETGVLVGLLTRRDLLRVRAMVTQAVSERLAFSPPPIPQPQEVA